MTNKVEQKYLWRRDDLNTHRLHKLYDVQDWYMREMERLDNWYQKELENEPILIPTPWGVLFG